LVRLVENDDLVWREKVALRHQVQAEEVCVDYDDVGVFSTASRALSEADIALGTATRSRALVCRHGDLGSQARREVSAIGIQITVRCFVTPRPNLT
jgi:hypothetical protein